MDSEKFLINKLKLLCGVEFTSNLEGMINDYFNNRELNEKYMTWYNSNLNSNNQNSQSSLSKMRISDTKVKKKLKYKKLLIYLI